MAKEEYYKLSLLKKTEDGAEWENIYIKTGEDPKIVAHIPQTRTIGTLNSKIEKISNEAVSELLNDLEASDRTH